MLRQFGIWGEEIEAAAIPGAVPSYNINTDAEGIDWGPKDNSGDAHSGQQLDTIDILNETTPFLATPLP